MNRNRLPPVNSVDNISHAVAIVEVWRDHYESILNYVDQSKYTIRLTTTLCNIKFYSRLNVSVVVIADAINNSKRVNPLDGLTGEAFIYSSEILHILLSLGSTSMPTHFYLATYSLCSIKTVLY